MVNLLPRLAVLAGANGSLTPTEIATAAHCTAEAVLLLDATEAERHPHLLDITSAVAETIVVDFGDLEAVCRSLADHRIDAVTTFVDTHCTVVDEINSWLFGRPALPGRWNKDVQRRLLHEAGASTISNSVAHTDEEVRRAVAGRGLPVVVKPVNGVASRDIWLISTAEELDRFLADFHPDRTAPVVVETYVPGPSGPGRGIHRADYLSAELFVTSSGVQGFVTDRPPLAAPCRETGIVGPTTIDPATERKVLDQALRAHKALALGPGTFHIEIKLTDDEPEVLEVNGRLGGYVRRLVELGTGTDLARAAIAGVLDRPLPLDLRWGKHVAALLLQAPMAATRIAAVPRRRDIMRLPGVVAVDHIARPGDRLDWRDGTGAASAKVWLEGDDDTQLRGRFGECALRLAEAFEFLDADGRRVRDDAWLDRFAQAAL